MWIKGLGKLNFMGNKEKLVEETIKRQVEAVRQTIEALEPVICTAEKGDWVELRAASDRVSDLEGKADTIHREGMVLISSGAFFAGIREDMLNLMEQLDDVADSAKDAARVIAQFPVSKPTYESVFSGDSPIQLVKKAEEAMDVLSESIELVMQRPHEAARKAIDVERKEEEGDDIKNRIVGRVLSKKGEMDVLTLLELKDFVLWLDNVLDDIEDASDVIIVIAAKSGV